MTGAPAAPIRRGQLIEISPCLRFPRQMYEQLGLKHRPERLEAQILLSGVKENIKCAAVCTVDP